MSHLGKLKPSQLYVYDRLVSDSEDTGEKAMADLQTVTHLTQNLKDQLNLDDGLGKYQISPLGHQPTDTKYLVRTPSKLPLCLSCTQHYYNTTFFYL